MKKQTAILLAISVCILEFIIFIFIGELFEFRYYQEISIAIICIIMYATWGTITDLGKIQEKEKSGIIGIVASAILLILAILATIVYNFHIVSIVIDLLLVDLLAFAISSYEQKRN
jgi:4-amino-4-deoxy-L-arabinose transferase-like glycosyltransferase